MKTLIGTAARLMLTILTLGLAWPSARAGVPPPPKAGLSLHVSPGGSDTGSGSAERPFASLERARDELRARRKAAPLPAGGVVVLVHGGEYAVTQTFTLTEGDSGTEAAPIRYQAADQAKPLFRGGTRLRGWRPLAQTDGYRLLPETSRAKVWILDLQARGITNLLPLKLGGFASGNGFITHPAHELFFNGQAMPLARGPNDGFLHIKDVAVKDGTSGYDRKGSKVGEFVYEGDRPSKWAAEPDLLLYGYWFWDWADSYERVASIDPQTRRITLAKPWHNYGFSVGAPFYAINALSELDAPGEWYLDRQQGRILFYAPSDPTSATIEFSRLASTLVELQNVSQVSFEGLTWELGSADGIRVQGGTNCRLAGCTVRYCAGNGVEIHGGSRHAILSCDIYSLGRAGTYVSGGNRKTLTPGGHAIENCDIHDLSRIDHTYTPAVVLDGVGNRIAHNRFHEILSSGMRVEGNDHVIEYNEIFHVVLESDDQGGADMFGNPTYRGNVFRYNYWHHIGNWRGTGDQPKCGQAGIRLDDAICGTAIYGNLFERCSAGKLGFGGVQIHGGKDNVMENNVFCDCAAALSFSPWGAARWREYVKNALDSPEIDRALYVERYPALARLAEDPDTNLVRSNLMVRCGEMLRRAGKGVQASNNTETAEGAITLRADNPLFTQPGAPRIPVAKIGLYPDSWRDSLAP